MKDLPFYIPAIFVLTTGLTLWFFYRTTNRSRAALIIALLFLAVQMALGLMGFFQVTDTLPPRFVLLAPPPVLLIISLFFSAKGKHFLDSLDLKFLTLLHIVRIPVELVLYWLFLHQGVPELMTFEGRNFDIFSGLTAPLVYYFGFVKKKLSRKVILLWNFICLGLLFNIVINAILAAPTPIQQFAFDQPNIAILYFPFVWLAGFIVPVVLLAHLAAIRQLLGSGRRNNALNAV